MDGHKIKHISLASLGRVVQECDFDSATIWDLPEDYFLGKLPDAVNRILQEKFLVGRNIFGEVILT